MLLISPPLPKVPASSTIGEMTEETYEALVREAEQRARDGK